MDLLTKLSKGPVICAEGYLFELERRGYLKAGAYVPEVVLDYPQAVEELHREFLRAGSDVIEAFTYYAHRDKMKLIGRENDLEKLNRQALQLAKKVAAEGNALMAGNICNTWVYDHKNHEESSKIVRGMYEEQVQWAKEGGADFIIAETIEHVGEALIALDVIKKKGFQSVITFASTDDTLWDGTPFEDACKKLEDAGADVVGLNCTRGPNTLLPLLKKIREKVNCHVAALPVPYRTTEEKPTFQKLNNQDDPDNFYVNLDPHLHTRTEMADFARKAVEMNINYLGVCCGAGPHHIRSIAEALGRKPPASKYSPDFSQHGMLGNQETAREHNKKLKKSWVK